jgi:hypothetical protein
MKMVKLRVDGKVMKKVIIEKGLNYKDKNYEAKEEDGMITIEIPEERAAQLLGESTSLFSLLAPEKLTILERRVWGASQKVIQSVSAKAQAKKESTPGPEDKALELIDSIEKKYESLDWEKEQFVNFCEENDIKVPGNWGITRIIKELVKYDSELTVSLSDYLAR